MDAIFREKDLPVSDLKKIGLYRNGYLDLDRENMDALLAGRRTDMIPLRDLKADGFRIPQLNARLSLSRQPDGNLDVMVHPIYKEAQKHDMLPNDEAERLQTGKLANIRKTYTDTEGKTRTVIIEYDGETREFISYDPSKVIPPDSVNNVAVTPGQQEDFRNGKIIELKDGTKLQHKAVERRGILSNRTGLLLSIIVDGGISYFIVTGIRNLMASKERQKEPTFNGLDVHGTALPNQRAGGNGNIVDSGPLSNQQQSRGYGRSSSR